MWDPVSVFMCMWVMNAGLPDARLKVEEVLKVKEEQIIVDHLSRQVTLREGE